MKTSMISILLFLSTTCSAQEKGNSRIIIVLKDTTEIYNTVKYALVNSEFIVKDNGKRDTITTYVQEYGGIFCRAQAIINGNTVTLSGVYGLKRLDEFGYTNNPKNYERIIYYSGSKGWRLLSHIAALIGGDVSYKQ